MRLHSIAIRTGNFERTLRYLTEICGLPESVPPFDFGGRPVAWLGDPRFQIELLAAPKAPPTWAEISHLALATDRMDQLAERGIDLEQAPFVPATGRPEQEAIAFARPAPGLPRLQFRGPAPALQATKGTSR